MSIAGVWMIYKEIERASFQKASQNEVGKAAQGALQQQASLKTKMATFFDREVAPVAKVQKAPHIEQKKKPSLEMPENVMQPHSER